MQKTKKRIILHSGGAKGADYEWARLALETDDRFFIEMHSFYNHDCKAGNLDYSRIHRRVHSFDSMQKEAMPFIQRAAHELGKNVPTKPYILNLQLRDYYQIANSEYVFAISTILEDMKHVNGGTGWAIECAKSKQIPILVFDQNKGKWFAYQYHAGKFAPCKGIPPQGFVRNLGKEHITGIGTRNISKAGIEAIRGIL